jgi:methyltransferase (TIGR00027 family)
MEGGRASGSAVLVCQGRAVAHGRLARGRFADPTALALLRDDEVAAVERARSDEVPNGWSGRINWQLQRLNALVNVPRTVAIDDAVRAGPTAQVVVLGAGLDGRAWRMDDLAGAELYEVDHPDSQADKQDRAAALGEPVAHRHLVPVDFRTDDLGRALAAAGHDAAVATTWIWEGVVAYLTPEQVEASTAVIADRSAAGSRLVVNYQTPSRLAMAARALARALMVVTGKRDPMAGEPRRSSWTPQAMSALLTRHGFNVVADDNLYDLGKGLPLDLRRRRSLGAGRVAVADRPVGQARLILTCGLPGAGKTTLARQLSDERGAVRLTTDEWMWALGSSPWDGPTQKRFEQELWNLAQQILRRGLSVVLDFGLWTRVERDEMRSGARRLGVGVELHYLTAPVDELWKRIEARNSQPPWDTAPILRSHLDEWAQTFEAPDAVELALFDAPPHST